MLWGDFLLENLIDGRLENLRENLWNVRRHENGRILYDTRMGTGVPSAFLTGLGRNLAARLPFEGMGWKVAGDVAAARFFNALLSGLTPFLLFLLARTSGLSPSSSLAWYLFLLMDPILRTYGVLAHMESILTVSVPASLLVFEIADGKKDGGSWYRGESCLGLRLRHE